VEFFGVTSQKVMTELPNLMSGREQQAFEARRESLVEKGVPEDLAIRVAVLPPAYMILGIVETATREGIDALEVARVHFALGERLGLPLLVSRILALPRDDRWQTMARAALRDDLHAVHSQLTARVLTGTSPEDPAPIRIAEWEEKDEVVVARAAKTLEEICADDNADLARMSVGLRVVRGLLSTG
jgi:glutamate dehydrogenase